MEIEKRISALYESGTGSWDTIAGKRVSVVSWWMGLFQVDGKVLDYTEVVAYLSEVVENA